MNSGLISWKERIFLMMFGLLVFAFMLEIVLRLCGVVFLFLRECRNEISLSVGASYRILCLGESTTARGGEYSWPAQLERMLNSDEHNIKFSVINKGVEGIESSVILGNLEEDIKKYSPQMVITMFGVNDWVGTVCYKDSVLAKIKLFIDGLRTRKLIRLCYLRIINKVNESSILNIFEALRLLLVNSDAYVRLGDIYRKQGKVEGAEMMFKKALELDPVNNGTCVELGNIYKEQGKTVEAEMMFEKAIAISPKDEPGYTGLGCYYRENGFLREIAALSERIERENIKNDRLYGFIATSYMERGEYKKANEFYKKANEFRMKYYNPGTKYNYQQLKEIVISIGIRLICMQYPVRNVESLKRIFDSMEGVRFVDNEKIFKSALMNAKYSDYFTDNFGGEFGHCTPKGNRLIAENVASVILSEIKNARKEYAVPHRN